MGDCAAVDCVPPPLKLCRSEQPANVAARSAITPDEVETVALQKCQQKRKGNYTVEGIKEKIPGFVWSCELTLIDRTIPAVVYRKTFEGDLPIVKTFYGNVNANSEKVISDVPRKEMYEFLSGLPHR